MPGKKAPDRRAIIRSPLSQIVTDGALTVRVEIFKVDGTDGWTLELIDEHGHSTVWLDVFDTDAQAMAEVIDAIDEEGLARFLEQDDDNRATLH